ncbi:hypothetical protein M422DRAFT_247706 [Sphaerobolus stellatus SS14]|nr:hypothetical protein M422DRAFT_247706 [Sphaerobolus stellatus SS14]
MLGGPLGIFPAIRALEFMRRYLVFRERDASYSLKLENTFERLENVLAQEQFRRWATSSFKEGSRDSKHKQYKGISELYAWWAVWMETVMRNNDTIDEWFRRCWPTISLPGIIQDIAKDAMLRERGFEPNNLLVRHTSQNRKNEEVTQAMELWCGTMDKSMFMQGGIVERGWWHLKAEWCSSALLHTVEWLKSTAMMLELNILDERKWLFLVKTVPTKQSEQQRDDIATAISEVVKADGLEVSDPLDNSTNKISQVDVRMASEAAARACSSACPPANFITVGVNTSLDSFDFETCKFANKATGLLQISHHSWGIRLFLSNISKGHCSKDGTSTDPSPYNVEASSGIRLFTSDGSTGRCPKEGAPTDLQLYAAECSKDGTPTDSSPYAVDIAPVSAYPHPIVLQAEAQR